MTEFKVVKLIKNPLFFVRMDLAIVVQDVKAKDFPVVDVSVGGQYVIKEKYMHQGREVGNFTSHNEFYISDGRRKEKIGEKLIEYTAPCAYVDEKRLGTIPASELEMRKYQLSLCLEVSRILSERGITTTITGKSVEEITSIVGEWTELMSSYFGDNHL